MFEKKELKSDVVYNKLKNLIIDNKLQQGSPLSERKICEMIETSRTPVREALKRMHNEGFVDFTPEYGAFVSKVTYDQVIQVYDIREMLEALAVRSFTKTTNEVELKVLNEIFDSLESTTKNHNYSESLEIDLKFHHFIIDRCRNEMLQRLLKSIFEHTDRIIKLTHYSDEWALESIEAHRKILTSINNRDLDKVEVEMRHHVKQARERQLRSWMQH